MFQNKLMSVAFGCGRRKVNEGWTEEHNEAINHLFSSQSVIRTNKSNRMKQPIWQARET
jgi:hypothetical protein